MKLIYIIFLYTFLVGNLFAQIITPPNESIITPIELNDWKLGIIPENQSELWFSFVVEESSEYLLMAIPHTESGLEYQIYDPENTLILNAFIIQPNTLKSRKVFESSGRHLLLIRNANPQLSSISFQVRKIEDRTVKVIDSIWFNQTQQALDEYNTLLASNPNDPELNLVSSALEFISIVENPDQQLSNLLRAYNAEIDFFPQSTFEINTATTTEQITAIQQYTRDVLIPTTNRTLSKLGKISFDEPFEFIIPRGIDDQHVNNYQGWFFIDNADVTILSGALHISKSLALLFNVYVLDIDPIEFNETFESFTEPTNLQQFMDTHPTFLSGSNDIQNLIQSALSNWLLGSEKLRDGLDLIAARDTPQSVHLFYLEDHDDFETIKRYSRLFDRMIFGMITATGGDFNGDTRVDRWDLYDLGTIINQ